MSDRKNKEVNIRFLRQGLIKAVVPAGFEKMTKEEKLEWANKVIDNHTDDEIIQAMADYEDPKTQGFFDAAPSAEAIELSSEPYTWLATTETWEQFLEKL